MWGRDGITRATFATSDLRSPTDHARLLTHARPPTARSLIRLLARTSDRSTCQRPSDGSAPFDIEDGEHPAALAAAIAAQTAVVADSEARGDHAAVTEKLAAAATWGDANRVAEVLRTCYVTSAAAVPALAAAAEEGFVEVVELLLRAGTPPAAFHPDRGGKRNALHVAAAAGQEACAIALVGGMTSAAEFETLDGEGLSALAILRRADMAGMARRLDKVAASLFDPVVPAASGDV